MIGVGQCLPCTNAPMSFIIAQQGVPTQKELGSGGCLTMSITQSLLYCLAYGIVEKAHLPPRYSRLTLSSRTTSLALYKPTHILRLCIKLSLCHTSVMSGSFEIIESSGTLMPQVSASNLEFDFSNRKLIGLARANS